MGLRSALLMLKSAFVRRGRRAKQTGGFARSWSFRVREQLAHGTLSDLADVSSDEAAELLPAASAAGARVALPALERLAADNAGAVLGAGGGRVCPGSGGDLAAGDSTAGGV